MITALNKHTGEVVELPADTYEQVMKAWQVAQEYEKMATALKDQLKPKVQQYVHSNGTSEDWNGYMFRVSQVQRMKYDKAVLRQHLDEDTLDLLLEPKKTAVDNYIKENLEQLGDSAKAIRSSMVEDGPSFQQIRLEKVTRD